jgi:hypothetical protein
MSLIKNGSSVLQYFIKKLLGVERMENSFLKMKKSSEFKESSLFGLLAVSISELHKVNSYLR